MCALCFSAAGDPENERRRLAATLLNQLLLVFLVYRTFRAGGSGDWTGPDITVPVDEKMEAS